MGEVVVQIEILFQRYVLKKYVPACLNHDKLQNICQMGSIFNIESINDDTLVVIANIIGIHQFIFVPM